MIQTIVSLYRAAIVGVFIAGSALAAMLILMGSWGILIGIALVGALAMSVGISAVLLSINDHLSALRTPASPAPPIPEFELRGKSWATPVATFAILTTTALALYASGIMSRNVASTAIEASPLPVKFGSSVKDGCVPELAAKVGLKCRD